MPMPGAPIYPKVQQIESSKSSVDISQFNQTVQRDTISQGVIKGFGDAVTKLGVIADSFNNQLHWIMNIGIQILRLLSEGHGMHTQLMPKIYQGFQKIIQYTDGNFSLSSNKTTRPTSEINSLVKDVTSLQELLASYPEFQKHLLQKNSQLKIKTNWIMLQWRLRFKIQNYWTIKNFELKPVLQKQDQDIKEKITIYIQQKHPHLKAGDSAFNKLLKKYNSPHSEIHLKFVQEKLIDLTSAFGKNVAGGLGKSSKPIEWCISAIELGSISMDYPLKNLEAFKGIFIYDANKVPVWTIQDEDLQGFLKVDTDGVVRFINRHDPQCILKFFRYMNIILTCKSPTFQENIITCFFGTGKYQIFMPFAKQVSSLGAKDQQELNAALTQSAVKIAEAQKIPKNSMDIWAIAQIFQDLYGNQFEGQKMATNIDNCEMLELFQFKWQVVINEVEEFSSKLNLSKIQSTEEAGCLEKYMLSNKYLMRCFSAFKEFFGYAHFSFHILTQEPGPKFYFGLHIVVDGGNSIMYCPHCEGLNLSTQSVDITSKKIIDGGRGCQICDNQKMSYIKKLLFQKGIVSAAERLKKLKSIEMKVVKKIKNIYTSSIVSRVQGQFETLPEIQTLQAKKAEIQQYSMCVEQLLIENVGWQAIKDNAKYLWLQIGQMANFDLKDPEFEIQFYVLRAKYTHEEKIPTLGSMLFHIIEQDFFLSSLIDIITQLSILGCEYQLPIFGIFRGIFGTTLTAETIRQKIKSQSPEATIVMIKFIQQIQSTDVAMQWSSMITEAVKQYSIKSINDIKTEAQSNYEQSHKDHMKLEDTQEIQLNQNGSLWKPLTESLFNCLLLFYPVEVQALGGLDLNAFMQWCLNVNIQHNKFALPLSDIRYLCRELHIEITPSFLEFLYQETIKNQPNYKAVIQQVCVGNLQIISHQPQFNQANTNITGLDCGPNHQITFNHQNATDPKSQNIFDPQGQGQVSDKQKALLNINGINKSEPYDTFKQPVNIPNNIKDYYGFQQQQFTYEGLFQMTQQRHYTMFNKSMHDAQSALQQKHIIGSNERIQKDINILYETQYSLFGLQNAMSAAAVILGGVEQQFEDIIESKEDESSRARLIVMQLKIIPFDDMLDWAKKVIHLQLQSLIHDINLKTIDELHSLIKKWVQYGDIKIPDSIGQGKSFSNYQEFFDEITTLGNFFTTTDIETKIIQTNLQIDDTKQVLLNNLKNISATFPEVLNQNQGMYQQPYFMNRQEAVVNYNDMIGNQKDETINKNKGEYKPQQHQQGNDQQYQQQELQGDDGNQLAQQIPV